MSTKHWLVDPTGVDPQGHAVQILDSGFGAPAKLSTRIICSAPLAPEARPHLVPLRGFLLCSHLLYQRKLGSQVLNPLGKGSFGQVVRSHAWHLVTS